MKDSSFIECFLCFESFYKKVWQLVATKGPMFFQGNFSLHDIFF